MHLPDSLGHLFWSYDISSMDTRRHKQTIIKTVLTYGDWEEIEWLFATYGRDTIKEVFLEDYYGLATIPDPTRRLWEILFLPIEKRRERNIIHRWRCRRLAGRS